MPLFGLPTQHAQGQLRLGEHLPIIDTYPDDALGGEHGVGGGSLGRLPAQIEPIGGAEGTAELVVLLFQQGLAQRLAADADVCRPAGQFQFHPSHGGAGQIEDEPLRAGRLAESSVP